LRRIVREKGHTAGIWLHPGGQQGKNRPAQENQAESQNLV